MTQEKKIVLSGESDAGRLAQFAEEQGIRVITPEEVKRELKVEFTAPPQVPIAPVVPEVVTLSGVEVRNRYRTTRDNSKPFNFHQRKKKNKAQRQSRRRNRN